VEYKGEHIVTDDDAKEKRKLGELWAARSRGRALFLMAEKVKDKTGANTYARSLEALWGLRDLGTLV